MLLTAWKKNTVWKINDNNKYFTNSLIKYEKDLLQSIMHQKRF